MISSVQNKTSIPPSKAPLKPAPKTEPPPPAEKVSLSGEQSGPKPGFLSAMTDALSSPQAGLANRAAGTVADTLERAQPGARPNLPLLNAVAAPINAAQGGSNLGEGSVKWQNAEGAAETLEAGAQMGQGAAQLTAAGAGGLELAGRASSGLGAAGALGKTLLKFAGPAIPAFEGAMNLAQGYQAGQRGDTEEQLKKNYSGGAKLGGAGMLALGNPVTATIGGGIVLGTSIADELNKTEAVQWAQDKVAGWFSGPQSLPPVSKEEMDRLIAEHRARRASQPGS